MPFGRKINPEKDKGDENSQGNERNSSSSYVNAAISTGDQEGYSNEGESKKNSITLRDSFFIDLKDDDHCQLPYFLEGYSLLHECITDYPTMQPKITSNFNHSRPTLSAVLNAIAAAGLASSFDVISNEKDTKETSFRDKTKLSVTYSSISQTDNVKHLTATKSSKKSSKKFKLICSLETSTPSLSTVPVSG